MPEISHAIEPSTSLFSSTSGEDEFWDIVVVGAGAAGLMAAVRAAEEGRRTLLLEKNRKAGVKILMSGGTRCNLTHATDNRGIVEAFGRPGRFLNSALAELSVDDTITFFEEEGVATKVEETGKVFPVSNKAADVLNALLRRLHRSGARLSLGEPLLAIQPERPGFVLTTSLRRLRTLRLLITTGGKSYPGSGTTGDGYGFIAGLGHSIVPPRPALVPVTVAAPWISSVRGITVPDVIVRIFAAEKRLVERRGSLLFAHFGLSGPVILDVSRVVSGHATPTTLTLELDLLPCVPESDLDAHLQREAINSAKKQLAGILQAVLPRRLADIVLEQTGLPVDRKAAGLTRKDRSQIVQHVKHMRVPVTGTLGFGRAEVTAGGVTLDEVDSRTLQSKLCPELFIAGEVLDLDGPIGGYNFQAAFSTGWLAGAAAAESVSTQDVRYLSGGRNG
jgi:predicted Rossmann fold flavoprotein